MARRVSFLLTVPTAEPQGMVPTRRPCRLVQTQLTKAAALNPSLSHPEDWLLLCTGVITEEGEAGMHSSSSQAHHSHSILCERQPLTRPWVTLHDSSCMIFLGPTLFDFF